MTFIIDMNLSPQWVPLLVSSGHEAQHWSEVGANNADDETIIGCASTNSRTILTHDLDFGIMLAVGGLATPSVIQLRSQAVLPSDMGDQVLAAIQAADPIPGCRCARHCHPRQTRITVLPISRES